ncbi:hypothetical protein PTI98_000756 [Pleurotus ostreatus]|nr:hypothetical protein PTI98_000756 [Pleurotus ostreatus]
MSANGRNVTALNNYLQDHGGTTRAAYNESQAGVQNAPTWTIVCKIDQQARGAGTHSSKSVAKDEASRRALEVCAAVFSF